MNLPGEPKVEEIEWPSEYGAVLPGRVYSYAQGASRYSVTVIDYTDAERIHAADQPHRSRQPADLLARRRAGAIAVATASAHHSHGNYNMTAFTNLTGVIKEVHWINPHTWIYLEVKDEKGEPDMWALEGASVVELQRRGWTRDMVKVGCTISVRCHQLRDGSTGCLLGYITPEGGVEKIFD